jgi:hypothetical protein
VLVPVQIVGELTVTSSDEPTVTVATADPVQVPEVPVTVYEVVLAGETEIESVVSPPLHEYESAPVAANVALVPVQIVGELTVMSRFDPTVTVATAEPVQEPDVPVTVYEVVLVGETEIESVVSPPLQTYESAPLAINIVLVPVQIVGELTVTSSDEPTVTVATAEPVQVPDVPVTVYEVVLVGETEIVSVVSPPLHE